MHCLLNSLWVYECILWCLSKVSPDLHPSFLYLSYNGIQADMGFGCTILSKQSLVLWFRSTCESTRCTERQGPSWCVIIMFTTDHTGTESGLEIPAALRRLNASREFSTAAVTHRNHVVPPDCRCSLKSEQVIRGKDKDDVSSTCQLPLTSSGAILQQLQNNLGLIN